MNEASPTTPKCVQSPTLDQNATCSECGVFGAFDFDGVKLCANCYTEKGSCCPEFGKDDLWQAHEAKHSMPS